jgi:esterase/lipase
MVHGQRTPRVFVLLHGFTDAPKQFEALGARFFDSGDNVYIPRLPHHAERDGKVRALGRITAGELAAFGDSSIDIARGLGDTIIVVGLSAGGNIAASIAQHRADVLRAVLIAPAIAAGRLGDDAAHRLVLAGSRLPNNTRSEKPDSTRPDFVQGISTRGLAQVLLLGETIRDQAEKTSGSAKQIAFLLNQNDQTVSGDAAIDLARRWTTGAPLVSVYQFPAELRLPHNVMEATERGGNTDLVLPVVEAIARGSRTPEAVRYQFIVSDWNRPRDPFKGPAQD